MRATLAVCVAVFVAAVVLLEEAEGTLGLAAAFPTVASLGGLAALKVIKYVGLSKLKAGLAGSGVNAASGLLSGAGPDLADSGYDYQDSHYTQPLYHTGGPPAFYIVPAYHFDDFRRRGRRATVRSEGVVAVGQRDYWGMVSGLDGDRCAMKVVCELAQKSQSELSQGAQTIKNVFSYADSFSHHNFETPRGLYDDAYLLGLTDKDPASACSSKYSTCKISTEQMLAAVAKL